MLLLLLPSCPHEWHVTRTSSGSGLPSSLSLHCSKRMSVSPSMIYPPPLVLSVLSCHLLLLCLFLPPLAEFARTDPSTPVIPSLSSPASSSPFPSTLNRFSHTNPWPPLPPSAQPGACGCGHQHAVRAGALLGHHHRDHHGLWRHHPRHPRGPGAVGGRGWA